MEIKKTGRPAGRDYPIIKQVRFGTAHAGDLALLVDRWGCTESGAIRRAVREKAQDIQETFAALARHAEEEYRAGHTRGLDEVMAELRAEEGNEDRGADGEAVPTGEAAPAGRL